MGARAMVGPDDLAGRRGGALSRCVDRAFGIASSQRTRGTAGRRGSLGSGSIRMLCWGPASMVFVFWAQVFFLAHLNATGAGHRPRPGPRPTAGRRGLPGPREPPLRCLPGRPPPPDILQPVLVATVGALPGVPRHPGKARPDPGQAHAFGVPPPAGPVGVARRVVQTGAVRGGTTPARDRRGQIRKRGLSCESEGAVPVSPLVQDAEEVPQAGVRTDVEVRHVVRLVVVVVGVEDAGVPPRVL
jgi:hypothetical protein